MAESKLNFAGLVKIVSSDYSKYTAQKVNGKIVFAEITGENAGKYIWANGVEYKVADATNLDELIQRVADVSQYAINVSSALNDLSTFIRAKVSDLNTYVHETVDVSVNTFETWRSGHVDPSLNAFDSSLINHEDRIKNLEDASTAHGNAISDLSTYVHTTVDGSISDISSRLASVGITAVDNKVLVNNTSIALVGDNYISLTSENNTVSAAIKDSALVKGSGTGASDVSLATKGYVDEQVAVLEQALVFKGSIASTADASTILTDGAVEAGWTYVATGEGVYDGENFESGDLIIVKTDSVAGSNAEVIIVERNLDGAVTAAAALDNDYVILGSGNQAVKVSTIEVNTLLTAIANANSAIQDVTANSSTANYIDANAVVSSSTATVTVGAKVVSLANASANNMGLADALDVRTKLEEVEEVMASANAAMSTTLGMNSSYGVDWTVASGIPSAATYKEAIEGAYAAAGVTSFGSAKGDISIDNSATDGDVSFGMNSSTLVGKVSGWNTLVGRVADVSQHAIDNDASIVDLSTNVIPTINSSISRLDSSVSGLETWKNDTSFVNTLTGDDYVKVDHATGDVTISTTIGDIATATTDASGLATAHDVSVFVNDVVAWAVITD